MPDREDLLLCSMYSIVSTSIGALAAFGLSFTNLSPLVIGGIIGTALPALVMACYVAKLAFEFFKEGEIGEDDYQGSLFLFSCVIVASAAVGVGLIAAASTYGIMTTGTVLTGATIGALSPITGFFATFAILTAAFEVTEKVDEYIVSPVIEKVKGCFSSQGQEEDW